MLMRRLGLHLVADMRYILELLLVNCFVDFALTAPKYMHFPINSPSARRCCVAALYLSIFVSALAISLPITSPAP
jgi:hypothetical protein